MRSVQATASSRGALVVRAATQRKPAGSAKKSAAPKTANPGRTLWLPNTVRGDGRCRCRLQCANRAPAAEPEQRHPSRIRSDSRLTSAPRSATGYARLI